jgi:glycosyltransferase involved in cell wall biosynthesis
MLKKIKQFAKKSKTILNIYEFFFQRPIINYFKKDYQKKVLFSYSTYHFNKKNYSAHSNYQESLVIAKEFDKLSYQVDIYNNHKNYNIDYDSYDVIFGEGILMYQAIQNKTIAKTIYYATGSHPWQCTNASLDRVIDFYDKTKFLAIESTRLQDYRWGLAASLCTEVLCIGNENTKKTFLENNCKYVSLINPTFHAEKEIEEIFKLSCANKTILYFASYGLLHKGMDLVIEAMKDFPDWSLHICGYTERENDFLDNLTISKNTTVHGFIDIESDLFKSLSKECGYVILPSSSEGIATAVITAMGRGAMIPIVTKECGVDIKDFGIEIERLTVNAVKKSIKECENLEKSEFLESCKKAQIEAYESYTIESYTNTMRMYLLNINNESTKNEYQ